MKSTRLTKSFAAIGLALLTVSAYAQHDHLNVGALGTNQNAKLIFANGSDFIATSGYVKTLTATNGGVYAGYYQGSITPTVLPATPANAGPDPAAPALGSYIKVQLVSLDGPKGGIFNFWETGATNPSISLAVGQIGTNMWNISSSDGTPGSDPYGHIHGRRFTVTKSGIYKVGIRAVDTSTNGVGGGPIQSPSDILPIYFEGDVNLQSVTVVSNQSHIRFVAPLANNWQLESSAVLGPKAIWTSVGVPITGDDLIHETQDSGLAAGQRYYRLHVVP